MSQDRVLNRPVRDTAPAPEPEESPLAGHGMAPDPLQARREAAERAVRMAEEATANGGVAQGWQEAASDLDAAQARVSELTRQALGEAHAEKAERAEAARLARSQGKKLPPISVRRMPSGEDRTLTLGPDGKLYGTPGYTKRWVRDRDASGRDSAVRISELSAAGFRPVKDADGKVVLTDLGVLMECKPEDEAAWRTMHLVDKTVAEQRKAQAEQTIDQIGKKAGGGRPVIRHYSPSDDEVAAVAG